MGEPQTITVKMKVKYLWIIIGVLLLLLATSPIYYTYGPKIYSSNGSSTSAVVPPSVSGVTTQSGSNSGSSKATCQNPCTIYIKNSIFGYNASQTQYVKAGTTVTWKNIDDTEHTSTSDPGVSPAWNSGVIGVGKSFSHTFNQTGTYPYHCNIHPMTATIVVVS